MGLENVQVELAEKINRDNVELIVHKKYEDIVQYLHEALHASKSDEEMFNRKADELRDAVKRLGISKADRFEIAAMQDSVMKTENMVTKLKAQDGSMGESIRSADVFSKTEISELLAAKVDRVEYEQSIRDLQKRRFSRIGLTEAPEKASPAVGDNYVKGENILPVPDAVRETRLTPIVTTRGEDSAANSQYIQASSSQKQQLTSNIRGSPEQSQKALGAIEGKGLGGGSSGKSVNLRASDSASAQIQATDRSAVVRVPVTGTDLGNFLKMSTLQTAGRAMFPQDLFRSNKTTDKHTTGLNAAGESSHSVPQSTYLPEYEFAAKADMSFVGASVIGAGFNTRSANIVKGPVLAYHQTPSTADTKS